MLREDELRDAIVIIFANKQDVPHAITPLALAVALGLRPSHVSPKEVEPEQHSRYHEFEKLENVAAGLNQRYWRIQPTVAITGEGIYEGFQWIDHVTKLR